MPRKRPPVDLSEAVEGEVKQLSRLTGRLGDLLDAHLDRLEKAARDAGKDPDADAVVPDADWVRAYRAYELSVNALMTERRKNAALLAGVGPDGAEPPLGDDEYQATLDALLEKRMGALTEEQLGRMMFDKMKNQEGQ